MITKKKTEYLRVFSSLALPIFLAVFFVFKSHVFAAGPSVVINEIMTADQNSTKNEFIELYNQGSQDVDLAGFRLVKKTASGSESTLVSSAKFVGIIKSHGYFVIAYPDFKNSVETDLVYSSASYSIADDNTVLLYDENGEMIDKVGYGGASDFETKAAQNPEAGFSLGRLEGKDTADNSQDFAVQNPSPGKENKKLAEKISDPLKTSSNKIQITELFPNPFQAKYEEYVELYNGTGEDIDLLGWTLHDASKSGKYTFPESLILKAKKYLAVFKKDFKFALNNSGQESVTLFDPNGKEVFKVQYDGSKKDVSYNFDGNRWRWSKFLTPGTENIFNNEPYGTVKMDEDIFVNVYANFSVSIGDLDGDKISVTWDFGDGHKSYLAKTKHKYVKEGKYSVRVKLSDSSEDVVKNFTVEVGQVPHPKVRIVAINANPKGADTGEESLTIENQSKKKINLNGWSIATGWKKFVNHPIKEDVIIKKDKTAQVTSDVSSFSLNNTKARIQLRYPDGKVAQEVKYKKAEGIQDGEVYQKVKGGWVWKIVISNQELVTSNKNIKVSEQEAVDDNQKAISNEQEAKDNNQNTLDLTTGQSGNVQDDKRENKILTGEDDLVKIELLKNQPAVLGAETVREVGGQYLFTPQIEQKHYLVSFWEKLFTNLNADITFLLNSFLK